jgi:twitching motility protein PilJ
MSIPAIRRAPAAVVGPTDRGELDAVAWPNRVVTLLLTACMLLALAFAFASILSHGRHTEISQSYLRHAAHEPLLARQVSDAAADAIRGDDEAFARLLALQEQLLALHQEVQAPQSGVLGDGVSGEVRRLAAEADAARRGLREDVNRILAARGALMSFYELAGMIDAQLCELTSTSQGIAELLATLDLAPSLILDAALQVARAQRMREALDDVQRGNAKTEAAVDAGTAAADEFEVALAALRNIELPDDASSADGVPPAAADLRADVEGAWTLYRAMRIEADDLVAALAQVRPARAAAAATEAHARELEESLGRIVLGLRGESGWASFAGLAPGAESTLLFGGISLIFLGLLGLQQLVRSRRRARASQAQNLANRRAIERLLDEMSGLADGDLTVEAQVSSEVTGAIADTVNYVVTALRALVTTINDTSARVNESAQRTRGIAKQLAEGSDAQARQIEQASDAISSMTGAIDSIARDAAESAAVTNRSVDVAGRGAQAVRDTINGMDEIRGRIKETSKRIRRLGDSSQEIGEMVELIDDIADQTNILALNAAMQAAMAGEAGRGFAVVADEVQRLAERSGNATKQIDAIVRTIRRDTVEAVRSMEASMAGVDSGAKVAENAGNALKEIEKVSNYIAELTRRIADSAGHESREAIRVNETVKSIQAITLENTRGTRATAEAVDALAALAVELRRSVAGFKLPAGDRA